MVIDRPLYLRSAHLLLKILEELVERQLYRTFDNHIRGSGDFAFHLSVCIVVNSSARGAFTLWLLEKSMCALNLFCYYVLSYTMPSTPFMDSARYLRKRKRLFGRISIF